MRILIKLLQLRILTSELKNKIPVFLPSPYHHSFFIFFIYFEKIHGISTYWPSFVVVNIVRLSKTCNWQYATKTYYYNTRKQDYKIWEKRTYFSIFIKYEGSRSNGINPEDKLMLTKLKSWEQNLEAVKISCRFYLLH